MYDVCSLDVGIYISSTSTNIYVVYYVLPTSVLNQYISTSTITSTITITFENYKITITITRVSIANFQISS